MGMICRFVWGAVNLTEFVKNFVWARLSFSAAFERLFPLTWSAALESGVYRYIIWATFFISTLVFVASWFTIAIPDFGCAWVAGAATGQPAILARTKAGHEAC